MIDWLRKHPRQAGLIAVFIVLVIYAATDQVRPRPTPDEAAASVEEVLSDSVGQRDILGRTLLWRHADPAGVCVVKDGLHFTRSGAESCARNSVEIAWKREKNAQ